MSPLVIATHNEGKAREIGELLVSAKITVLSAATLGLPEPEETGDTFAANALIKSESAAKLSGHHALADDSGLCVVGLEGAPGIYSARWAGSGKDFTVAAERICSELMAKNIEPNGAPAYFICVLALTTPDGKSEVFEGRVDGILAFPARGTKGFGYDPIFIPEGCRETFAEMEPAAKHAMSHRARAFAKFMAYLAAQARREAS
jgi:XTP/dITP diphosphohydrolase